MKTILRSITRIAAVLIAASVHLAAAATEKLVYFHNDLAGTPIAATDSFGNLLWQQSYKPYGERLDPKAPAKDTPWFSDKAYVEGAGLSYFGARWYDPRLGRFMGIDPKGFDEANVLSFNRYAYANDNPYRYVDPDGRQAFILTTVNQGAVIGGGKAATDLGQSVLGKPSEAQQIRQPEGFGGGQSLPSISIPDVRMADPLALILLGGAQMLQDRISSLVTRVNDGDKDPSTPVGRKGNPLEVRPGTNEPANIGGRDFTGHALDRMQGRGIPPSAVEEAIGIGRVSPGNMPHTTVHTGSNGVTAVTGERGQVITVISR